MSKNKAISHQGRVELTPKGGSKCVNSLIPGSPRWQGSLFLAEYLLRGGL